MNVDLSARELELVRRAAVMGGWLTASYCEGSYHHEIWALAARIPALFVDAPSPVPVYRLTEEGKRVAAAHNE